MVEGHIYTRPMSGLGASTCTFAKLLQGHLAGLDFYLENPETKKARGGDRTHDLLRAEQNLCRLSYSLASMCWHVTVGFLVDIADRAHSIVPTVAKLRWMVRRPLILQSPESWFEMVVLVSLPGSARGDCVSGMYLCLQRVVHFLSRKVG